MEGRFISIVRGTNILLDRAVGPDVPGHERAHAVQQATGRVRSGGYFDGDAFQADMSKKYGGEFADIESASITRRDKARMVKHLEAWKASGDGKKDYEERKARKEELDKRLEAYCGGIMTDADSAAADRNTSQGAVGTGKADPGGTGTDYSKLVSAPAGVLAPAIGMHGIDIDDMRMEAPAISSGAVPGFASAAFSGIGSLAMLGGSATKSAVPGINTGTLDYFALDTMATAMPGLNAVGSGMNMVADAIDLGDATKRSSRMTDRRKALEEKGLDNLSENDQLMYKIAGQGHKAPRPTRSSLARACHKDA